MNEELKNENEMGTNNTPELEVPNSTPEIMITEEINSNEINDQNTISNDIGTEISKQDNNDFEDFREKKNKKGLIIGLSAMLIVLLAVIGGIFYIKKTFNASSFLDQSSKKINTFVNEVFEGLEFNKEYLDNIDTYDLINETNIKLTTNSNNLKDLNNLEIGFKTNQSIKNNYLDVDLNLKQDTGLLNGTLVFDNNKIYIDSKDIIDKVLTTTSKEDIFGSVNEYTEKLKSFTKNDISSVANNLVKYMFEAFKEADINTKLNGLKATYTYEINDNNKTKINDKFMDLVKNDKALAEYVTENSLTLENVKAVIEVTVPTNSVESFTITSDDIKVEGTKIENNKYKVTSGENTYEIEVTDEKIVISGTDENNKPAQAKIEVSNDKTMIVFTANNMLLDITLDNKDKDTPNIEIKVNTEDLKINGNITLKNDEKNKKNNLSGKISLNYKEYDATIDITSNSKYGNNLVTKKNYTNTTDINNISDEDSLNMITNLMGKASKFNAYNFIQNLFNSVTDDIGNDIEI